MTKKNIRLISKLEIKGPNLIKGIQFDGYRVLGLAENFARDYYENGIDELIYQDTVASLYQRDSLLEMVKNTSKNIFIPLTVAGGVRTLQDIDKLLNAGADKVAINTAACKTPKLIEEASKRFGSQCIVASIETYKQANGSYEVWTDFGREVTTKNLADWAKQVEELGAGEILLTSIFNDGLGSGYDLELISKVSHLVDIPVVSSGGAHSKECLLKAVNAGADGVCSSSIFHYNYALKNNKKLLTHKDARLRMGNHIDTGNYDFLHHGYGKERSILVEPCSIASAKEYLIKNSVNVRPALQ